MNDKQQRAYAACEALIRLGLSQKEIAARLGVHAATINRVCNLTRDEWPVGEVLVKALESLVPIVLEEKSEIALANLPINVWDTCNDAGVVVDERMHTTIRQSFVTSLAHSFNPDIHIPLPEGIEAAIASLGHHADLILIKLQRQTGSTREAEINFLRMFIHELEHLIERLSEDLPAQEESFQTSAF